MEALSIALVIALLMVLAAEFVNGWTDAPNAIATVVSTGVMSPRAAIVMAVVLNTLGAMAGTAVAATVGNGIVSPSVLTLATITSTMISIVAWGTFAAKIGIPVSKSHALLAGLAGAGLAGGGWDALVFDGWIKVAIGLVCSLVFGALGAWILGWVIIRFGHNMRPTRVKHTFDRLQILSAAAMAFNHGLNDGQKFMGVFAMTLLAGGAIKEFVIPFWVILACALTMGIGTSFGGWRIIETVGSKMTKIKSWQGFAACTSASVTIFIASHYGVPLSTTHTITSSIVGVGAARRVSEIRWSVLKRIMLAWVATFPCCAALAYVAALIVNHF